MELTIQQLINSASNGSDPGALDRLATTDLPIKTSFRLKQIVKAAADHLLTYEESKLELFKKHGEHDPSDDSYSLEKVSPDTRAKFDKEFQDLMTAKVQIPGDRFRMADFYSHTAIRAADLIILEWLIDDGMPVKKAETIADLLDLGEKQAKTATV